MGILLGIVLIVLFVCSPVFRCSVFHPFKTVFNTIIDMVLYILRKGWRICPVGLIVAYCGLFGKGKTLSAVHDIVRKYEKYNGKMVYDKFRKKWVKQKVQVLSNVSLSIPYIEFTGLQQIVDICENRERIDALNNTLTITLVLIDEASVQLNSREYKKNFSMPILNSLLTCRHHYLYIALTSQRFQHIDILLRGVISYVVDCNKLWRFQRNYHYDAWEMENATNVMLLKPFKRKCWFVRNKDFRAYDTLACVNNLVKECRAGKMLSDEEIIALRGNDVVGVDGIVKPSRKLKKARKHGA